MSAVLLETLAWTGMLIAAVLLLRRPVTRHFGAQAAYALWALPAARLAIPPVVLPAWMAPRLASPPAPVTFSPAPPAPDAALWQAAAQAPATGGVPAPLTVPVDAAPQDAAVDLLAMLAGLPLAEIALAIWLGGAAVFLALRFAAYFSLRDQLLAEGREVGRVAGLFGAKVRLIETPATNAPLAMGVLDPVIALPPGFLALHDRTGRDLALAHELAHHRGGDLLVNILVQPLFAMHWFNPLSRYGWLALRRDQEAACDARVMARRGAQEKAAYAALIARFAAAPGTAHNAALTAPMACPVLGEKSIIHRLRSLAMSDPTPRRRMAGRALLGAGLLALPLTASITYAASENILAAPEAPEPPAPPALPAPPQAPDAPEAPDAPTPPEPPRVMIIETRTGSPDGEKAGEGGSHVTERVWRDADGKERRVKIVARQMIDGEALARELEAIEGIDKGDRGAMLAELRAGLAEADRALADLPRIVAEAQADGARAQANAPRVMMLKSCTASFKGETEVVNGKDGKQTIMICQPRITASARAGLEEARAEIARDKDIPEDQRKQILRTLDSQIARWKDKEG